MISQNENKVIYLIAGEPSGDILGANLMRSIYELTGHEIEIIGIGGPKMNEQGLHSLFPITELSVMGLTEIIPLIPKLLCE